MQAAGNSVAATLTPTANPNKAPSGAAALAEVSMQGVFLMSWEPQPGRGGTPQQHGRRARTAR